MSRSGAAWCGVGMGVGVGDGVVLGWGLEWEIRIAGDGVV